MKTHLGRTTLDSPNVRQRQQTGGGAHVLAGRSPQQGGSRGGYRTRVKPATSNCLDRGARDVQRSQMKVASGAQFVMPELPSR